MKGDSVLHLRRNWLVDKRDGVKRAPLLTITDLAREVGVNPGTLWKRFHADGDPVQVKIVTMNKNHYPAAELRAWHAAWVDGRTSEGE